MNPVVALSAFSVFNGTQEQPARQIPSIARNASGTFGREHADLIPRAQTKPLACNAAAIRQEWSPASA